MFYIIKLTQLKLTIVFQLNKDAVFFSCMKCFKVDSKHKKYSEWNSIKPERNDSLIIFKYNNSTINNLTILSTCDDNKVSFESK